MFFTKNPAVRIHFCLLSTSTSNPAINVNLFSKPKPIKSFSEVFEKKSLWAPILKPTEM
jgi:hypothetical protein